MYLRALADELSGLSAIEQAKFATQFLTPVILVLTFWVTIRLTRSQKVTDTTVECGRTFSELMKAKWDVKNMQRPAAVADDQIWQTQLQQSARFFYGQFFSFQFSEFAAFRSGFIDITTFTIWMRSRRLQWERAEAIHGVTYREGWQHWVDEWHHGAQDTFVRFMGEVHDAGRGDVYGIVGSYAPILPRCICWLSSFLPFRLRGA